MVFKSNMYKVIYITLYQKEKSENNVNNKV